MIGDRFLVAARNALLVVATAVASLSCDDKVDVTNVVGPGGDQPTTPTVPPRRVVGIVELTFRDINTTNISASLLLAATVADLERLRSTPGSIGNVVVVTLDAVVTSEFAHTADDGARTRFVRATFGLRNARRDSALFDRARENLSFVPVRTSVTVANTPMRVFQREDGLPASDSLARLVAPTALTAVDGDGKLVTIGAETLTSLTEEQARNTAQVTGTSGTLPYTFMVRAPSAATALAYDGFVTFAYRLPIAANAIENPTTFSVLFLIVDDTSAPRK